MAKFKSEKARHKGGPRAGSVREKRFYVTTAIDYPNARPHIGHAYEKVLADVIARWHRLKGECVFFLTGTDEHGIKIERAASQAGKDPKAFVDAMVPHFQELCRRLTISNDGFIRTTEQRHIDLSRAAFRTAWDKGLIYKGRYEGPYCAACESYYTEKDLLEGALCPVHKKPIERMAEESYFFKLGQFKEKIVEAIERDKLKIVPIYRKHEILHRLKEELRDLSVSRATLKWGIPLPIDEGHTIYVWFDALLNYLSGIDWPSTHFWHHWPADVHVIGKDITWFHAVIWPAILMALDLPPPKALFVHGFVNVAGEKMSKTKGTIVDPLELLQRYPSDGLRYHLLSHIPTGEDGDFSESGLIESINNDLADDLGNLLMRVLALLHKHFGGEIPRPGPLKQVDRALIARTKLIKQLDDLISGFELSKAVDLLWSLIRACNAYMNETEPWRIKEKEKERDIERRATVLYVLVECLRIISIMLRPFLPLTAQRLTHALGQPHGNLAQAVFSLETKGKVAEREILFHKISPEAAKAADPITALDLRVGEILEVDPHPGAEKLYLLKVDLGPLGQRNLVGGLRPFFTPEQLKGQRIIVLANIKPAVIRGFESNGMLLAAVKESKLVLPGIEKAAPGTKVLAAGHGPKPAAQLEFEDFAKLSLVVRDKRIFYDDAMLITETGEEIVAEIEDGAVVR